MRMYSFIRNSQGASLIQVMVSVTIMAVAAVGFATLMAQQLKFEKGLQQKYESIDLGREVRLALADPINCVCQLTGAGSGGTPVTFDSTKSPSEMDITGGIGLGCSSGAPKVVEPGKAFK